MPHHKFFPECKGEALAYLWVKKNCDPSTVTPTELAKKYDDAFQEIKTFFKNQDANEKH